VDAHAGDESRKDRKPACPVCGRLAGTDYACAECDWTLRSARRLGPVTREMRADFDRKLAAARRQFDATAAALVSADPGRLARWIRGGTPSPGEWSAARLAAVKAASGARDEPAAIAALATALRPLAPGAGVTIVEIGQEGVVVTRVSLDKVGAPVMGAKDHVKTWPELIPVLAAAEDERYFQLAGGIAGIDRDMLEACLAGIARLAPPQAHGGASGGGISGGDAGSGEVLVMCQPAGWRLLEDAAQSMLAGLGGARLLRITGLPASGNGLLASLPDRMPLLRGYGVVVAAIAPSTGAVTIEMRSLFRPGAVRGAVAELDLRRAPGDRDTATLAVAISGDASSTGTVVNGAGLDVLSLHSVPLPDQPAYRVRAVLEAPGRIRFIDPAGVTQLSRPWQDVLAALPDRVDVQDGPVDLVCALELAGPKSVVDRRRDLVRSLLRHLAEEYRGDEDRLRVGLLGCTDHVFAPGEERRRVVRTKALGPLFEAVPALARFSGADIRYQPAAPLEDMLHLADEMLAESRTAGRAARLLLVAGRRPHPRKLGTDLVHPCPFRCDWRATARKLGEARVPVVAVVDAMPGRAARIEFWGQVAPAGVRALDDASAPDIAADLGLTVRRGQQFGIPLAG
jgi:hypothetical protein